MNAAVIGGIVLASLLGSLHCAGMCGAFVSLACGFGSDGAKSSARLLSGYHFGRLVGYVALGALAGTLGSVVDLGASAVGLGRVAAVAGAVTMLVVAVLTIASSFGGRVGGVRVQPPALLQRAFRSGVSVSQRATPGVRALLIGLLTVLLPCGWLYAFAVVAASTASAWQGAVVMGAFWVGTVPVLSALGLGVGSLRARLGGVLKPVSGVLILALGIVTLTSAVRVSDERFDGVLTAVRGDTASPPTEADCPLCETSQTGTEQE